MDTSDGTLLIFDAPPSPENRGNSPRFLTWWREGQTSRIFLFSEPVYDVTEVQRAVAALERDLGAVVSLPQAWCRPELGWAAVDGDHDPADPGSWYLADRALVFEVLGWDGPLPPEPDGPSPLMQPCEMPPLAVLAGAAEIEPFLLSLPVPQTPDGAMDSVGRAMGCGGGTGGGGGGGGGGPDCPGDRDCDGIPDGQDGDVDGDGIPNGSDPDVDGDGYPNDDHGDPWNADGDIDGDGIPNDEDDDKDGDGIPDAEDPDDDGDGIPDGPDPVPGGCSGPCCACNDRDACTTDTCDELSGCSHISVNCDDGDACNGQESCDRETGCRSSSPGCGPCEECEPVLLGCVPVCGCPQTPITLFGVWQAVPDAECMGLGCSAGTIAVPTGCTIPINEVRCYRRTYNSVNLSPGTPGQSHYGAAMCCNCSGGCPSSGPPGTMQCGGNIQECYTSTAQFSLAPNVTWDFGVIEGALELGLGYSVGSQTCVGGNCAFSLSPCGWVNLEYHVETRLNVQARVTHDWQWFYRIVSNDSPGCSCTNAANACGTGTSHATGNRGFGVFCNNQSTGTCPPNPCSPGRPTEEEP